MAFKFERRIAMPVTQNRPGPYAPSTAVLEVVTRYRNRGLPTPVNAEILARAGVSESLLPRTLQALQTLDLIDQDGAPTQTLEGLRLAPEAEYRDRLAAWLKGAYADVFTFVDPSKDDATRVRDAFRGYQPVGQQDRMVSLFQGLCAAAGLLPEKASKPSAQRPGPARVRPGSESARRVVTPKPSSNIQRQRAGVGGAIAGIPAPLAGLLANLPQEGEGWTADRRDKFMAAFKTVIDFCFPITPEEPSD
jgi:hypothetical protein